MIENVVETPYDSEYYLSNAPGIVKSYNVVSSCVEKY